MSIFGRLLAPSGESKVVDATALTFKALFGEEALSKTGLSVTTDTALRVSAVFGCCRVLCEDIAKLPLKLMRERRNGSKEVAADHPLHRILSRRPNEWMTSFEWRETMLLHALLSHGGYSVISRRADTGEVLELIPVPPSRVKPVQDAGGTVHYEVRTADGQTTVVPFQQMHVVRGMSWNGLTALEVVAQGREAIGLAMAAEQSQARLYGNGARPGGIISTPGVLKDEQIKRIRDSYASTYSGLANAFKMIVLDGGMKFEPWQMTGKDAEQLDSRKHQVEEVCRFFRVFPQMIGFTDKAPTYASAESFFGAHVGHSLQPWVTRWEQSIARDLISGADERAGYYPKFFLAALLRGSADERAAYYKAGINDGWMTRNEVRRLEDLDPLPGLDQMLQPLNMAPVGDDPDEPEEEPDEPDDDDADRGE